MPPNQHTWTCTQLIPTPNKLNQRLKNSVLKACFTGDFESNKPKPWRLAENYPHCEKWCSKPRWVSHPIISSGIGGNSESSAGLYSFRIGHRHFLTGRDVFYPDVVTFKRDISIVTSSSVQHVAKGTQNTMPTDSISVFFIKTCIKRII